MIDGVDTNVALASNGATADQSGSGTDYPASKAIDGRAIGNEDDLANTGRRTDPWW